jgi:hypothetical protein
MIDAFLALVDPQRCGKVERAAYVKGMQTTGWLRYHGPSRPGRAASAAADRHRELLQLLSPAERDLASPDALDVLEVMDPDRSGVVLTEELLEVRSGAEASAHDVATHGGRRSSTTSWTRRWTTGSSSGWSPRRTPR